MRTGCPKCGGHAWYELDNRDIWLRCLCGLRKLVQSTVQTMTITHSDGGADVALPRQKTKLHFCLMMVSGLRRANTQEITDRLNLGKRRMHRLSVSEVSTQLTVLKFKGLVHPVTLGKGMPGGSTWELTPAALRLLKGVRSNGSRTRN